jgi:hypothetical protein
VKEEGAASLDCRPPRLTTVWTVVKMKLSAGYCAIATTDWSIWAPVLITFELAS